MASAEMPTPTKTLFAYGPWAPGNPLFWKLEQHLIRSRAATVRGSLYRSQLGLPLFVNEGKDVIRGHYLELKPADLRRKTLEIDCVVEGKVWPTEIFAYLPEQLPKPLQKIPKGDWAADQRRNPDRLSKLGINERNYLLQLSTASGVAADPSFYRQLLKLGLLQDSGSNWGLSPLGRAAAEYLAEAQCPTTSH